MSEFEPVIGLEIHAELSTITKMFCGCRVVDATQAEPNIAVCEICTGMPGTLPVINQRAVEYALRVALAMNCQIAETSIFARKNYFYPDLPKGYQISQYEYPLAANGWLDIDTPSGERRIRIRRVHLEEDTGKLTHVDGQSLIDFNRSGVPLLEIVSEPDLFSSDDAHAYGSAVRSLLRYLEVNSGDMQKGVIRFEANISLRPVGSTQLGTRTEIKNLNSFRAMTRGVSYEIVRQGDLLRKGQPVQQETLGWDEARNITVSQRSKEEAHDYRYFPEPDLPPLVVPSSWVAQIRSELPELPAAKRKRLRSEYGLSLYAVNLLTSEPDVADFYESAAASGAAQPLGLFHWLAGELFGILNQSTETLSDLKITPGSFARLVGLVESGLINASSGKVVLAEMVVSGQDPAEIVRQRGLEQLNAPDEIGIQVEQVLIANPALVADYLAGKESLLNWFFGQVMKSAAGQANPQVVRQVLKEHLDRMDKSRPNG